MQGCVINVAYTAITVSKTNAWLVTLLLSVILSRDVQLLMEGIIMLVKMSATHVGRYERGIHRNLASQPAL